MANPSTDLALVVADTLDDWFGGSSVAYYTPPAWAVLAAIFDPGNREALTARLDTEGVVQNSGCWMDRAADFVYWPFDNVPADALPLYTIGAGS